MSSSARLASLRRQHAALHAEIEDEERRPGVCSLVIHQKKCKKLRLKDEIARLAELSTDAIAAE